MDAIQITRNLPADRNPGAVYLASLKTGSVPAQRSALRKIAGIMGSDLETMDWASLRYQHVQFIRARLQGEYAATTVNRLLTALRRVLYHAWRLDLIPDTEYRKLVEIEPVRGSRDDTEDELMGRALSPGEISALVGACLADKTPAGARDAAIIALGYGLGLRRAEVAKLDLDAYNREKNTISVRGGKGNRSRTLPIDDGAQDALEYWLSSRGDEPGRMFWGVNRGGKLAARSLNVRAINEMYAKRTGQAKVYGTNFHDLRRSFISDLLDRGNDLATVSKLAGHSDPRTTLRYDRRTMDTRRKAIATLHVPFSRPE